MKRIRFTQSINLSITVETEVPEGWTDEDIYEFTKDCPTGITLSTPDPEYLPDNVVYLNQQLEGAEVTDAIVWP